MAKTRRRQLQQAICSHRQASQFQESSGTCIFGTECIWAAWKVSEAPADKNESPGELGRRANFPLNAVPRIPVIRTNNVSAPNGFVRLTSVTLTQSPITRLRISLARSSS